MRLPLQPAPSAWQALRHAGRPPEASRRRAIGCLAAASLWPLATPASSVFPQRPVRLVVPYAVGVGPDVVARSLGQVLQQRWGQPVVVDNRPGASGIVAFADVRRTAPDGHTLYLGDAATLAVNPLLHPQLPYDPQRDLLPLTLLFRATFVLWTGAGNPHASLAALLEASTRRPGAVSYGSLGHGHPSHLAMETLARAAGLQWLHVPFKDAGALMAAVAAGQVDLMAFSHHTVAGLLAAGRLRALAVAARTRLQALPDVPTLPQAGGPPVEMHPWAGLVTVAGTPQDVVDKLVNELTGAMADPLVRQRAGQAGFELAPSTPQGLRALAEAEAARVRPLLAEGRVERMGTP